MKDWTLKIIDMIERNYEYDPWIEAIDIEEALKEVEEEIAEIRKAISKDDMENLKEEVGDLLWTSFMVFLVASKKFFEPSDIVEFLERKMKRRKPYIFESEKPTLEEAVKIWVEAKKKEKERR